MQGDCLIATGFYDRFITAEAITVESIDGLNIPQDIKTDITKTVDALLSAFDDNVKKIILFGSYATGKYQPDSDIDLAVALNGLPDARQRRVYTQAVDVERSDLLFCTDEQLSENAQIYRMVNEQGIIIYEQL